MYLHLGRDYIVNTREVIGVFNLETTTVSPRGREFLARSEKQGAVVSLSEDIPRSYVITSGAIDTVFLSDLSPAAMQRRIENPLRTMMTDTEDTQ